MWLCGCETWDDHVFLGFIVACHPHHVIFILDLIQYSFSREYSFYIKGITKFNGFIDKASIKKDNYNENHLYEVPDFINHWKLREENKSKWISPSKFHV